MKQRTQVKAKVLSFMAGLASTTALLTTLPIAGAFLPSMAFAAEAAGNVSLEEIVVTARRRSESVQEVPAAITVFTAKTIEDAGIHSFADFSKLTPNLNFRQRYRPGAVTVSMRGITTLPQSDAPIAMLIDGVLVPGLDFINQELMDVESIQVLRGPQGGVYGLGAVAGAVLITTKQPGNEIEGRVQASYGNADTYKIAGAVSGPIVEDKLFFRMGASYNNFGGFYYNPIADVHLDAQDSTTVFGHLKAIVSDDLSVDIRGTHTSGNSGVNVAAAVNAGNYLDFSLPMVNYNVESADHRTMNSLSLAINYKTSVGTLNAVTAYNKSTSEVNGDGDFSPVDVAVFVDKNPIRAWSQDIRFTSPDDQKLRWVIGAFYQDRKVVADTIVYSSPENVLALPPGIVLYNVVSEKKSEAYAFYGQGIYSITDDMELELALRYDRDKRNIYDSVPAVAEAAGTFSKLQPKVSLRYNLSNDTMTYASFGQGFRSGGFNAFSSLATIPGAQRVYPKEVSNTWEIGFKSQFADRRLTINAAAFYIDYKNQQYYHINLDTVNIAYLSLDKSNVKGFEVEITATPTPGLDLTAAIGVSDSTIKDADGTGLYSGNTSPQSYASTINLSAQYRHPLADNLDLMGRVEYERFGKIYYEEQNLFPFPAADYINARLLLERGGMSFGFYGKNLTNEKTLVDFLAAAPGAFFRIPNLRRQYGIEANFKF